MTPLKVKAYLIKERRTTVESLSRYFEIESSLAKTLIDFWVERKGCQPIELCGDCHLSCKLVYQWIDGNA